MSTNEMIAFAIGAALGYYIVAHKMKTGKTA